MQLLALACAMSGFRNKSSLQRALQNWCADSTDLATNGHISTWNVSGADAIQPWAFCSMTPLAHSHCAAITDMSYLLYDIVDTPCRDTFNEDIDAWNVGQVTDTQVCHCPPGVGCHIAAIRVCHTR